MQLLHHNPILEGFHLVYPLRAHPAYYIQQKQKLLASQDTPPPQQSLPQLLRSILLESQTALSIEAHSLTEILGLSTAQAEAPFTSVHFPLPGTTIVGSGTIVGPGTIVGSGTISCRSGTIIQSSRIGTIVGSGTIPPGAGTLAVAELPVDLEGPRQLLYLQELEHWP